MGKKRRKKSAPVVVNEAPGPQRRLYDLPYSAPEPSLVNAEVGLPKMMARAGHNAAYTIDVTLLDASDHRLLRSGVLLAHRVLDDRGEWFLSAPDWVPLLPEDRVEPMGDAELPEEFANLIRPLRRRATLGPVAALNCDRREFSLRNGEGVTVALLRDDRVTVRRGGLTTARYREVTVTGVGAGLGEAQLNWLDRAFASTGATEVSTFPWLTTRLGAPATGVTDVPQVGGFDPKAPFKRFVSQLVALRLRQIVEADLAIRGGQRHAAARLAEQAGQLRLELRGLSSRLDPDWTEDLYDELDWVVNTDLAARLRSERYLTLLERLVVAVRSPQLAESSGGPNPAKQPTAVVLSALLTSVAGRLREGADAVRMDSDDAAWAEVARAAGQLSWVAELVGLVVPDETQRIVKALAKPQRQLRRIVGRTRLEEARQAAATLSGPEAFDAGRQWEATTAGANGARAEFLARWPKLSQKLPA